MNNLKVLVLYYRTFKPRFTYLMFWKNANYSKFLLFPVVMFYKVSAKTELVNTEPLFLGEIQN